MCGDLLIDIWWALFIIMSVPVDVIFWCKTVTVSCNLGDEGTLLTGDDEYSFIVCKNKQMNNYHSPHFIFKIIDMLLFFLAVIRFSRNSVNYMLL
jgi:hypothetical protein